MEIRTLCDLFYDAIERHRKPDQLKYKQDGSWKEISAEELRRTVEELSAGLRALGVERGDRVAILSENRPEWAFADLATLCAGAVDAPIYSTLPPVQVQYILKDSQAKVVFVSTAAQARKVAEVRAGLPHLRHVVRMDEAPVEGTLSLAEVRKQGRPALSADPLAVRRRAEEVRSEDLATLIYTSGTTGDPKGVMLTHGNLVSNVVSAGKIIVTEPNDVSLSFLPLCHVLERMGGYYLMLHAGVSIAYAESVEQVPANLLEVRPHFMVSVPRLYEKIHARIHEKVATDPASRQRIFRWAIEVGRQYFKHRVDKTSPSLALRAKHAVADRLVFSKIRARTGGRMRLMVSGGAPLGREIAEFFGGIGLTILEGYGLTETSPVICVNRPDAMKPGAVGLPLENVEVRIAADGEILTRGPHVMKGYFGKPEATAEAIEPDGWFHTGDIGMFDKDGFLVITDRKKDIIVTSGGKNVAPQPIENRIKTSPFVAEVVMIGNRRNFPSALVVPNFEILEKWAKEKGLSYKDRPDLLARPEVAAHYDRTIQELTKDLAQFERIKKVSLLPREFSLEAGELTPTLKVKRRVVEEKYKDVIDRMYEGPAA